MSYKTTHKNRSSSLDMRKSTHLEGQKMEAIATMYTHQKRGNNITEPEWQQKHTDKREAKEVRK